METKQFIVTHDHSIRYGWIWTITHPDWIGKKPDYAIASENTIQALRTAIEQVINAHTDADIISSLQWCDLPVWLSVENQINFKAAYDLAMQDEKFLPATIKLGQHPDGSPAYHTFSSPTELADFYFTCISHVQNATARGWQQKDSIDYPLLLSLLPAAPSPHPI